MRDKMSLKNGIDSVEEVVIVQTNTYVAGS
jgi:hypothetical protein